jgi:periplasmic divalent cation tolerance protein
MTAYLQVLTAVDTRERAQLLARLAVEARLAACAQVIGPITSTYWWQGRLETAEEFLCLVKTTGERYPELERAIREAHPYQVPEILATPVSAGLGAYLAWLDESTRESS